MGQLVKNLLLLVVALVLIWVAIKFFVSIVALLFYVAALVLIGYVVLRLVKGSKT
ncbi:hypothetical protein [Parasphingopyxis marina]|uniref:Uncharacterized protein n=1 Tax=Parasphingopyxis marina TaxID=2761622 RepID=A0A842I4A7_9SPHN|nr:hypothetical protein [Parasphingopyxis marina]MBC2779024.1 hypothetical protein [Parasphingopyxis marina]